MLFSLVRRRLLSSPNCRVSILSSLRFNSNLALKSDTFSSSPETSNPISYSDLKTLVLKQYSHGKFYDLIETVISTPGVLFAACRNLAAAPNAAESDPLVSIDSISERFSIESLACELRNNEFEVESCCIRMLPSGTKGEALVIPNLKLKVVIEAVRMVLEIVYEKRFATFSYGGRVGLGRHTAVRYLKNSVTNPSWWFTVAFERGRFDIGNIRKLSSIMEEKIQDRILMELIKRFFEFEAVRIEFRRCWNGRGLPQESGLSAMLINIYFDGFDREIQKIRLRINQTNPRFDSEELSAASMVFYKPVKVYAVRYLDEILVITSGSKMLTMDLKNRVVEFLEGTLELKVDKFRTAIHSAVSEKMEFIGMEFRAVPPSVLHPPMSDAAIRAQKKYIKRKQMKALELRNARETNRKKLGLKILNHVFKKLKRSDGFKFDMQIETEVRDIFRTWAEEVVQDFFRSPEDCWNWHRKLSSGNFMSLTVIRDQLPQDLMNAYDQFQETVDKYMNPEKSRKAFVEEDKQVVLEEEKKRYAERTVEDLTKLCMKVDAPIMLIRKAVRLAGFTNPMGRPRPIELLIPLEDSDIIKWYAGVGKRWLDYFCCCRNFKMVKTIVSYHLRFSCILTLAEKHESTKREAIRHYSKDLNVTDVNGVEEVYFPTEREIKMMGDKNLSDPKPVDGVLGLALVRLLSDEGSCCCVAHFCDRRDTCFYRVRLLQNCLNVNPLDEGKWVSGIGAIHGSLNRRCLPLCPNHISDLYLGRISLQDIDFTSCVDLQ